MGVLGSIKHAVHHLTHSIHHFFGSTIGAITSLIASVGSIVAFATGHPEIGYALAGYSFLSSIFSQPDVPDLGTDIVDNGFLVNKQGEIGKPIPIIYGINRVGGNIVFQSVGGENNKYLYQVIALGEGQTGKILDVYFDDNSLFPAKIVNKSSTNYKYKLKPNITNIKAKICFTYINQVPQIKHYCSWNEQTGGLDCGYEVVYKEQKVRVTKDITLSLGETKTISNSKTYKVCDNPDDIVDCHSYTITKDLADVSLYKDYYGNVYFEITTKESSISIQNVSITAYSTDNGDSYFSIDKKLFDKVDFLYFDGVDLYKLDKSNSSSTWTKVDSSDSLFQEFVSKGFMKTDSSSSAFNKLQDNKISLFFSRLSYNRDVFKNVPNITVKLEGKIDDNGNLITNPVDVLYDFLTNERYGLGISKDKIDDDWYNLSKEYCDFKNFEFNGLIINGKAGDIIQNILNHFRGDLVYRFGKYEIRFRDVDYEISKGLLYPDIVEIEPDNQSFNINYSDIFSMYDQIKITFINPTLDYKSDTLLIPDSVEVNGHIPNQSSLILQGCDKQQAKVLGTYFLERSRLSLTVNFSIPYKYIDLDIGQLFFLKNDRYGIKNELFRVIDKRIDYQNKLIQITAIKEDRKLYDDVYEPDIYNVDITQLPNSLDIWYDQTYVGNIKALAKSHISDIENSDGDLVFIRDFMIISPISRAFNSYYSTHDLGDNESSSAFSNKIKIFDLYSHSNNRTIYLYHCGYSISIYNDKAFMFTPPYTYNNGSVYNGDSLLIDGVSFREIPLISPDENSNVMYFTNISTPVFFYNTASANFLNTGEYAFVALQAVKDSNGNLESLNYRYARMDKGWGELFYTGNLDIKSLGSNLIINPLVFSYDYYPNSAYNGEGSFIYSITNNKFYLLHRSKDVTGVIDVSSIFSDMQFGYSLEFVATKVDSSSAYLYYINNEYRLVRVKLFDSMKLSDASKIEKTVLDKTGMENGKVSWRYDRGNYTIFMTENRNVYKFDKETEEIEPLFIWGE